ncbi:triose-phosphate transporter [Diplocarpon rosae]|nr:triose-phosphate transporter [Diplocarpon rosae]
MDPSANRRSSSLAYVNLDTLSWEPANVRLDDILCRSESSAETEVRHQVDEGDHGLVEELLSHAVDIEAQKLEVHTTAQPVPLEYSIPLRKKLFYLGTYLLLNLSLTIHSKILLGKLKYPFLLTAFHTGTTSVACYILMRQGYIKLTALSLHDNSVIVAFSVLCTINIATSNVSLALVSVSFHQIVRSTVPVFTIFSHKLYFRRSYSLPTYLSCMPIITGVSMAAYGEVDFTAWGFILTIFGVILAALKTVVSNQLMTGKLSLPPLELLLRISPLAAVQSLACAVLTREGSGLKQFVVNGSLTPGWMAALLINSFIAFLLNISSFSTNKLSGALTMTICGNLKQILTVLLGIIIFKVKIGVFNGTGMVIAVIGGAIYSRLELGKKPTKKPALLSKA